MKKLIVILAVLLTACVTACDAVKVSPASTVQAAVNATLTAQPPATSTPTAATFVVTEAVSATSTSVSNMPVLVTDVSHGEWVIKGTNRLADNSIVAGWLARLKDPDPSVWKYFPNVPNPDVPDFLTVKCKDNPTKLCVPDGIEYGTYDSPYCWQSPCDIPVGAEEYRYISGNYKFLNLEECKGDKEKGCMLVLVNVMDESYTWRNQYVDNGFTLRGRYFNGDALEWGIWGLVSNGSASMLNMETYSHPGEILNSDQNNSGANCGVSEGCKSVDVTVVVHAGDAIIAVAKTVVTK